MLPTLFGAAREFREIASQWNQTPIYEALVQQRVACKFNPPGVPHFGGVWGRLVRSCKKAMSSIFGTSSLTLPVLTTTVCLVEQTLNARPLTPVIDDPFDLEALTPNHFFGPRVITQPLLADSSRFEWWKCIQEMMALYNLPRQKLKKELKRPIVKIEPFFYGCFLDGKRAGDFGASYPKRLKRKREIWIKNWTSIPMAVAAAQHLLLICKIEFSSSSCSQRNTNMNFSLNFFNVKCHLPFFKVNLFFPNICIKTLWIFFSFPIT